MNNTYYTIRTVRADLTLQANSESDITTCPKMPTRHFFCAGN